MGQSGFKRRETGKRGDVKVGQHRHRGKAGYVEGGYGKSEFCRGCPKGGEKERRGRPSPLPRAGNAGELLPGSRRGVDARAFMRDV